MTRKLDDLEKELIPAKEVPDFSPGDSLEIHILIREGEKERIQIFSGTCIARQGSGLRETVKVRKLSYGEGVERILPIHSPIVKKIVVLKTRKENRIAPRAKLYYMRKKNR